MDQEMIIEQELEEAIDIIRDIYNTPISSYDSIQLGKELYVRMENILWNDGMKKLIE